MAMSVKMKNILWGFSQSGNVRRLMHSFYRKRNKGNLTIREQCHLWRTHTVDAQTATTLLFDLPLNISGGSSAHSLWAPPNAHQKMQQRSLCGGKRDETRTRLWIEPNNHRNPGSDWNPGPPTLSSSAIIYDPRYHSFRKSAAQQPPTIHRDHRFQPKFFNALVLSNVTPKPYVQLRENVEESRSAIDPNKLRRQPLFVGTARSDPPPFHPPRSTLGSRPRFSHRAPAMTPTPRVTSLRSPWSGIPYS